MKLIKIKIKIKIKHNDYDTNKEKLWREHVNLNNSKAFGENIYIKILKREHVNLE